ncbi:MAG: FtsQ-type POTRA domain-containing protein [Acidimicrobiia bacterium]
MSIDPRLVERRKTVAEDNAKRNVGRLLKFLVALVIAGGLVWLVFSPWLSVSQVDTTGIVSSAANSILVERGVVAGTPMFQVRESATETALLADPWIAEAEVSKHWPNGVGVDIVERAPVAWTNTASGWTRRAIDGVALPSATEPDLQMGRVEMPELADVAAPTTPDLLGALAFIDALPAALRPDTVVTRHDGELWATVSGFQVRLGRAVEMKEKALSLQALLEEQIPSGSSLVLIAPTNPAVMTPQGRDSLADESAETGDDTEADAAASDD